MKLRPFELALVVIFGVMMVLALILLRTHKPEPKENVVSLGGEVTIWGTLPATSFTTLIYDLSLVNKGYEQVYYKYVPVAEFSQKFLNALADGKAPDLLLLPHESLVEHRGRIEVFPYTSLALRDFKTTYVDGAEVFALNDGIYGLPVAVDPLMLYWNRDLFSFSNRLTAPSTWEEVVGEVVPDLTVRDFNRVISQSALAMGEYDNVTNAFSIISMLLLQGGSAMVTEEGSGYKIALDDSVVSNEAQPFSTAISFYTNFTNVSNTLYSWNKALPADRELFLREELAMYFGFGSEAKELETRNPNLNFDIAEVPQGKAATAKRTYGRFYSLMVPKGALNKIGAYTVMQELASQANAKKIADNNNLAPVHRATLAAGSNDVYGRIYYAAVSQSRAWLNPNLEKSNDVFRNLLKDVGANRSDINMAVGDAIRRLEQSY